MHVVFLTNSTDAQFFTGKQIEEVRRGPEDICLLNDLTLRSKLVVNSCRDGASSKVTYEVHMEERRSEGNNKSPCLSTRLCLRRGTGVGTLAETVGRTLRGLIFLPDYRFNCQCCIWFRTKAVAMEKS